MSPNCYRYSFPPSTPPAEVEGSLTLAVIAVQGLHGEAQAKLDTGHAFDARTGTCVVDAATPAGRDLNRLFAGFLAREFGTDGFRVERLTHDSPVTSAAAPTRN